MENLLNFCQNRLFSNKQEFCVEDSVGVLRSKDESHGVERIHYLFISLSPVNQKVKAMVKLFRRF